jgi:Domain of unknown function (DUF1906)
VTPIVEPVPDALIFDTDVPLRLPTLEALAAVGFRGGIRTVTVSAAPDPSDVTAEEVADFLQAGLGLMVYQRPRGPGWLPSATLGAADAEVLLEKTARAGILVGVSRWDDLEGISGTAAATVAYANAKAAAVRSAGSPPGEYIGFEVPLGGIALYEELTSSCYWQSGSNVPIVAVRGYAMRQIAENVTIAGVTVDVSFATADQLGGRAYWMRAAAAAAA